MMQDRLAIEFICAFGMRPDDFVRMASDLGVAKVGLSPHRITDNPHGYPDWDLRGDPALLAATKAALAETGVTLGQGEGLLIMPGTDVADGAATLDLMAELGAPSVNTVLVEQDRARAIDQFATLAELAAARGMQATIEFMPLMWPATVAEAMAVLDEAGAANGRLLIDAMHYFRSGATVADLAKVDLSRIGYIQICDVPMPASGTAMTPEMMQAYGEEARHERRCPGDGDLPLAAFLAALPRDLTVGLEVPLLSKAKAGVSPADAIRPCVAAAQALLTALD